MTLLKATREIKNKDEILEISDLLISLRKTLEDRHPEISKETVQWGLEQAIMRLSLNTGHSFE